jgi:polyhydroxyalkanoate synthase subunit PhaC
MKNPYSRNNMAVSPLIAYNHRPSEAPSALYGEGFSSPHKHIHPIGNGRKTSTIDRKLHALLGRLTNGISPAALDLAIHDWLIHLLIYPGQQTRLFRLAWEKYIRFIHYSLHLSLRGSSQGIHPAQNDTRFVSAAWNTWPYNIYSQGFLFLEEWWQEATTSIRGVGQHRRDLLAFVTRQLTDMVSPSNFPLTNPEILHKALQMHGANFIIGGLNWMEDSLRTMMHKRPAGTENFQPGEDVAVTPGKIVYRNQLIELIQYSPQTPKVYAEPILIIPAWIMKYYILDLSPHNSLVKYLVQNGHTVFMVSWKNPDASYRDYGMEAYMHYGIMDALHAISTIVPHQKIHTVGYCIGGTLLSMAASYMAREKDNRLATITLFAAQVDFEEAGELLLFIDESQLTYLEDIMWEQGYLESRQMSGAFNLLRSKDLIWSRMVEEYLKGERQPMFDLMAWNTDATRLPYQMHSEYLRNLFLNNDLTEGRYEINGERIALTDINVPIFAISTQKDHIAPWKSVYKIHLYTDTEITFALTSGGHNAGIISEPGHKGRSFQLATTSPGAPYTAPEEWVAQTPSQEGSWWPAWNKWLNEHSGSMVTPPRIINDLGDAPGTYVYEE